jgi:hypothetical protein
MSTPTGGEPYPPTPEPRPARESRATTALVLGIISVVCCQFLAPIAWYIGNQELKNIRAGYVSTEYEGTAKAGMILGIIGTILLGLGLLWIIFFGGLAMVGAILGG